MNIAFLCRHYGKSFRGAETYVRELSSHLSRLGHNVKIYPHIFSGIDKSTQILISTNGRLDAILARFWCLFYHAKLIIPGQSGPGIDDRWNLWCFPDTFVALTDFQLYWARKANPFVPIVKIPNGVDLSKFSPLIKPVRINIPRPIILCIAALTPAKRLDLAIKAVSRLKTGSLVLIGEGDQKDQLSDLCQQLLPGRFTITSFPHQHMPAVYAAADLFTFPTVPYESFGIALVEAMASGLPVVATDDPIRREIVGVAGLFVDPADTGAYAAALQKALKINWSKKPRIRAQQYSWSKIASDYDRLFRKLCSQ